MCVQEVKGYYIVTRRLSSQSFDFDSAFIALTIGPSYDHKDHTVAPGPCHHRTISDRFAPFSFSSEKDSIKTGAVSRSNLLNMSLCLCERDVLSNCPFLWFIGGRVVGRTIC